MKAQQRQRLSGRILGDNEINHSPNHNDQHQDEHKIAQVAGAEVLPEDTRRKKFVELLQKGKNKRWEISVINGTPLERIQINRPLR